MSTTNAIFYQPRPQFFDANGNPLSLGRLTFYAAGTSTLKPIYDEAFSQSTPLPNPLLLDIEGYVPSQGIWLGEGRYKLKVEACDDPQSPTPTYTELWTIDDVPGATELPTGQLSVIFIDTVINLPNLTPGVASLVYCTGYYNPGDGGEGYFQWAPNSMLPDDGGSVISPTGSPAQGRWKRLFPVGPTPAAYWGALNNAPSFVDGRLANAWTWCLNNNHQLYLQPGKYPIAASVSFGTSLQREGSLMIGEGVEFDGGSGSSVSIYVQTLDIQSTTGLITNFTISLIIKPAYAIEILPEWWYPTSYSGSDWYSVFKNIETNTEADKIESMHMTQQYDITATGAPSTDDIVFTKPHFHEGSAVNWEIGTFAVMNDITAEDNAYGFLLGSTAFNFKPSNTTVYASWYMTSGNDFSGSRWFIITNTATWGGIRYCDIVFDRFAIYTYTSNYYLSEDYLFSIKTEPNTVIDVQSPGIWVCDIVQDDNQLFTTGSALVYTRTSTLDFAWFGATYNSFTNVATNALVLTTVGSTCEGKTWTTKNATMHIGSSSTWTDGTQMNMIDCVIGTYPGWTSRDLLYSSAATRSLINCRFIGGCVVFNDGDLVADNCTFYGYDSFPVSSTGTGTIKFESCKFTGQSTRQSLTCETLIMEDCVVIGDGSNDPVIFTASNTPMTIIDNCKFTAVNVSPSSTVIISTGVCRITNNDLKQYSLDVLCTGSSVDGTIISNNTIERGGIDITNPEKLAITGNVLRGTNIPFTAYIRFTANNPGWIAKSITVTGNSFWNGKGSITTTENIASSGHIGCVVVNNSTDSTTASTYPLPSTTVNGYISDSWTSNTTNRVAKVEVSLAGKIIFPNNLNFPVFAGLAPTNFSLTGGASGSTDWANYNPSVQGLQMTAFGGSNKGAFTTTVTLPTVRWWISRPSLNTNTTAHITWLYTVVVNDNNLT